MQCHGLNRHCADRIIWAVIATRLINRKQLDEFEPNIGCPPNKLAEDRDIADPKIVLTAQPKKRRKNACYFLFRDQIHSATDQHR